MAGTRLLIQSYFVVLLVMFTAWATWHERIPRGHSLKTKDTRLVERSQPQTCQFFDCEPIAALYEVDFVSIDPFPFDELARALRSRFELQMANLSATLGVPIRVRSRRARPRNNLVLVHFSEPRRFSRCFRFVVEASNERRAQAIDSVGCDGGIIGTSSAHEVVETSIDIMRAALGNDLTRRSVQDNMARAIEELAMLSEIAHLTRPYDFRLPMDMLRRATVESTLTDAAEIFATVSRLLNDALTNSSLSLPQHLPPEHLAALYFPLVAPLVLPLILGLCEEYRRFRYLRRRRWVPSAARLNRVQV